jgi:hypothetical protein
MHSINEDIKNWIELQHSNMVKLLIKMNKVGFFMGGWIYISNYPKKYMYDQGASTEKYYNFSNEYLVTCSKPLCHHWQSYVFPPPYAHILLCLDSSGFFNCCLNLTCSCPWSGMASIHLFNDWLLKASHVIMIKSRPRILPCAQNVGK